MDTLDLLDRDATALAAAIRSGEVSSAEIMRAHLDRIEELNGTVNAFVTVLAADALAAANLADQARA